MVTADGFAARRGWATGGTESTPATRGANVAWCMGGVAGAQPPAQGRAEGPTAPTSEKRVERSEE